MVILQARILSLLGDPCHMSFGGEVLLGEVCVAWWKSGKIWWCNTLRAWTLHTLFLSLLPLRPSMWRLFLPVSLSCLQTLTKQKQPSQIFDIFFPWVAYAMSAARLKSFPHEVTTQSEIRTCLERNCWWSVMKGKKLCNKNDFKVDLANNPQTSVFY